MERSRELDSSEGKEKDFYVDLTLSQCILPPLLGKSLLVGRSGGRECVHTVGVLIDLPNRKGHEMGYSFVFSLSE